jgi:transposase-like protein
MNNNIKVIANKVDNIHFYFICPFCNKTHKHGSNGDSSNRIEYRSPHCNRWVNNKQFEIHITMDTQK